jgi:DnaA-homolog protein
VKQLALGVKLRANAVFANFSPGSNREVLAALGSSSREPIWLFGPHGSGKTHLLQAMCAATDGPAAYFALGASEDAACLPPEAVRGFAECRVVCIDDVDRVAGDRAWEEALFGLFNEAQEAPSRLVFAASAAPRRIDWLLDDWRSRAGACVVYQVKELDESGRAQALKLRAEQRGLNLPDETLDYLMKRMPRDLHSLFEILDELDEASLIAQRRLTIPFIRDELEKHAETKS